MILSKEERRDLEITMHKVVQVVRQCNRQGLNGVANFLYPEGRRLRLLLEKATDEIDARAISDEEMGIDSKYVVPQAKRIVRRRKVEAPVNPDKAIEKFKSQSA